MKGVKNILLSVKGKQGVVSGLVRYMGEQLLLPADEVLLPFGYDYSVSTTGELLVKYGDKEEIHTKLPTYKIGKIIYIPIQLLATALGMGLRWDYRINTLYINPVVYAVHYEKGENGEQISIHSQSEINPKSIFELNNPSRLILDIPNAVLDIASRNIPISSSNFLAVRVGQLDEETVRVVVDLKLSKSYGLSLSDDGLTAYILGAGKLQKLGFVERDSTAQLTFYSNRLASFNVSSQDQQLIIDFEDTIYGAKPAYFFQGDFLDKVFGAQHSWDPLSTRMNIYLKKNVTYKLDKVTDNVVLTLRKEYMTSPGKERKIEPV
ncbi:MAG: AMIN domain-containing protein, partial [Candidatus Margulisiibacteriota bacterium]